MEPKHLTPMEAWDDFYKNYTSPGNKPKGGIPNDLRVAQVTRRGKTKQVSGATKTLGPERIKRLLDKYAPGEYQFHEAFFTKP